MRFARSPFTIRSLLGAVAITGILVGAAIVLLKRPAPMTSTCHLGPPRVA